MGTLVLEDLGAVPLAEMREGLVDSAKGIPLRNREGAIVAFAMVDAEDYYEISQHRWFKQPSGYVVRNIPHPDPDKKQTVMSLHRAVMGLKYGDSQKVDHIDHDLLNNRKANLRLCTHALNHQNRKSHKGSSSQYRGVGWRKDRGDWAAYGVLDGKQKHIGFFDDEDAAGLAAKQWRAEHMPFAID